MTAISNSRGHLVERAAAALGSPASLSGTPAGQARPTAVPNPPSPPPAPAREPISEETLIQAGLIGATEQRSRLLEEVAVVQHQILRTMQDASSGPNRNARLVLITSALPGEGKSFCALNIAAGIAAASNRPAIVVDVDGKSGSLTEVLGCEADPGLRTLVGEATRSPAALLRPTARPGLSFLPYGAPAPGAPAVPSGAAIATAMLRLAAATPGQVLLLDSPPCLSTSEASLLAPVAGQVVLVVQAERAQRGEVEAALDMLESCPALQLLLNRMQIATSETFASQDYGAYGTAHVAAR